MLKSLIDGGLSDLDPAGEAGLRIISRGTAILLLGVYIAYLFFQVSFFRKIIILLSHNPVITA